MKYHIILGIGLGCFFLFFGGLCTPERLLTFSPEGTFPADALSRIEIFRYFWIGFGVLLILMSFFGNHFFQRGRRFSHAFMKLPFYGQMVLFWSGLLLFFCSPIYLFYQQFGLLAPFKFFVGDTFYYLVIAKHFAEVGIFSFDSIHSTNGFHPLWGYILSGVFRLGAFDLEGQVRITFFLSSLFLSLGLFFWGAILYQRTRSFFWTFFTLFPGYYYFLGVAFDPHAGNIWAFANGMESACSLLFGGITFWVLLQFKPKQKNEKYFVFLGIFVSFTVLSRLDDVFLYVAVLIVCIDFFSLKSLRKWIWLAFPGIIFIGSYLIYNQYTCGMAFPVSGQFKQGFGFLSNFYFTLDTFLPGLMRSLELFTCSLHFWSFTGWRILQMVFPALVVFLLFRPIRLRAKEQGSLFEPTLMLYILLKFFYNYFFVATWNQGQWYYPLSIVGVNVLITLFLTQHIFPLLSPYFARFCRWTLCFVSLLLIQVFWMEKWTSSYNQNYFTFFTRYESIQSSLQAKIKSPIKLLAYEDGILAYALGYPTLNGFGYALDAKSAEEKRKGQILNYAYEQGHNILGFLVYSTLPQTPNLSSQAIRENLAQAFYLEKNIDLSKWEFEIIYRDRISGALFLAFRPISSTK